MALFKFVLHEALFACLGIPHMKFGEMIQMHMDPSVQRPANTRGSQFLFSSLASCASHKFTTLWYIIQHGHGKSMSYN